jgi:hypothetical protein
VRALMGGASLIAVYAANDIAHTLTVPLLFPTGQDYLKAQGLDPKIADELSDRPIRVRGRDFIGEVHAATDTATLPGVLYSLMILGAKGNAFAIPSYGSVISRGDCVVTVPDPDLKAADFLEALTAIPAEKFKNLRVSDREMRLAVTFHEFSHCDTGNRAVPSKAESDADIRGVLKEATKVFDNPEIGRTMLYARVLTPYLAMGMNDGLSLHKVQIEDPHDAALDIDHAMHPGSPAPAADASEELNALSAIDNRLIKNHNENEIEKALANPQGEGVFDAIKKLSDSAQRMNEPAYLKKAYLYKDLLAHHRDMMSPSAQRKATLYLEALDYFGLNGAAAAKAPARAPSP